VIGISRRVDIECLQVLRADLRSLHTLSIKDLEEDRDSSDKRYRYGFIPH
jgi:hypothetical protein